MTTASIELPRPDQHETGPYALVGTARARPGAATALEAQLISLVEPTRREAGVLAYHVHRDRSDPDLFVFYEVWSSVETLRSHLSQPYIQEFLADRHLYIIDDLEIRWLKMSSRFSE